MLWILSMYICIEWMMSEIPFKESYFYDQYMSCTIIIKLAYKSVS